MKIVITERHKNFKFEFEITNSSLEDLKRAITRDNIKFYDGNPTGYGIPVTLFHVLTQAQNKKFGINNMLTEDIIIRIDE